MDYTEMVKKDVFFLEQMQRQLDMKRYIKEAQILSSGIDIGYRLNSINEDLSESLKGLWAKIKNIFNKIWLKFLEHLNHLIQSDAEYLKTYQGIILNKKAPDVVFTMPNYETARERCFAGIPDFTAYINVSFVQEIRDKVIKGTEEDANEAELKETWTKAVQEAFAKKDNIPYSTSSTEEQDFASVCNEYYGGGENIEITADSLNMTDVYNLCFSADTIISELGKTRTKYTTWITEVEKKYNAAYKEMAIELKKEKEAQEKFDKNEEIIKDDTTDAKGNPKYSTEQKDQAKKQNLDNGPLKTAIADAKKKQIEYDDADAKNTSIDKAKAVQATESYNTYSVIYNSLIPVNELTVKSNASGITSSSKDSNIVKDGSASNTSGVSNTDTNASIRKSGEAGRTQGAKGAELQAKAAGEIAHGNARTNSIGRSSEETEKIMNKYTKLVTEYTSICTKTITTIFGAKCNSIIKMRKDYMDVIRYHVKYWLGKENDTADDKTTQTPSTSPGIKNATVTKKIEAPGT